MSELNRKNAIGFLLLWDAVVFTLVLVAFVTGTFVDGGLVGEHLRSRSFAVAFGQAFLSAGPAMAVYLGMLALMPRSWPNWLLRAGALGLSPILVGLPAIWGFPLSIARADIWRLVVGLVVIATLIRIVPHHVRPNAPEPSQC